MNPPRGKDEWELRLHRGIARVISGVRTTMYTGAEGDVVALAEWNGPIAEYRAALSAAAMALPASRGVAVDGLLWSRARATFDGEGGWLVSAPLAQWHAAMRECAARLAGAASGPFEIQYVRELRARERGILVADTGDRIDA